MATLFDLVAKLTLDSSEYSSGLDAALGKVKSVGGTIAKVGTAAVGAAAAGIVAFGKSAVEAGMTFDSSMSQVAATMGTTVGEISELRDFAQEMGSTTAFSATQAADALNYMALAGYDAETSMQMLPNVLNLAAAGGIELASASDMVTDAQSALGLSLDETSELVDKMAKASSKSNTSVAQLGDAILTVGGTAKNLAGGTTELSTALGILADNGIKGAEGGTALRNIILALSAPTDVAAKKMQSLGLSAYDAEGNLRPLEDIFGDLNETLSTMTQGEQTEVLNTLFNKVDLKSANALLATSKTRWKDLSKEINNASGAAKNMADTQLDNLAGDITLFKSALEGAQIAISDSLSPTLRGFVQDASDGVSRLTEAFKQGGLTAAMEEAGDVLTGLLSRVVDTAPKVVEGALALVKNLGKGLIDNADQIFDAAGEIIDLFVGYLSDEQNMNGMVDGAVSLITKFASFIGQNAGKILPAATQVIIKFISGLTSPENADEFTTGGADLVEGISDGIIDSANLIVDAAPDLLKNLFDALIEQLPRYIGLFVGELGRGIKDFLTESKLGNIAMLLMSGFAGNEEGVEEYLDKLRNTDYSNPSLYKGVVNFGVGLKQGFYTDEELAEMTGNIEKVGEAAENTATRAETAFKKADLTLNTTPPMEGIQLIEDKVTEANSVLEKLWADDGLLTQFSSGMSSISGFFKDVFGKEDSDALGGVATAVDTVLTKTGELKQGFPEAMEAIATSSETAAKDTTAAWDGVPAEFGLTWDEIAAAFNIEDAETWGYDMVQNFMNGVDSKMDALRSKISEMAGIINSVIGFSEPKEGPLSDFHTYAPDMMNLFMQGITENEGRLRDTVQNAFDFRDAMTAPEAMTYSATGSGTAETNSKIDAILDAIHEVADALRNQTIEMDGEKVADLIDARLGTNTLMKARV